MAVHPVEDDFEDRRICIYEVDILLTRFLWGFLRNWSDVEFRIKCIGQSEGDSIGAWIAVADELLDLYAREYDRYELPLEDLFTYHPREKRHGL